MKKPVLFASLFFATLSFFLIACNDPKPGDEPAPPQTAVATISYTIVSTQPHDTSYFTEGFEFYGNTLIESTGMNGKSKLVQVEPKSGKVLKQVSLDEKYFGEGATVLNDTVYQLTWREHVVFVYSAKDFRKIREMPLSGEGWGLTNDGKSLIASTGSSDLFFYEPQTFKLQRTLTVTENGSYVNNLNELEYVDGFIYANQWNANNNFDGDYIFKINAQTGQVVGKLNLSGVVKQVTTQYPQAEVLNGIAYNRQTKKFHITGKNWPMIFEMDFGK
jgi:glutaminyl-peptide cyclotransferase